MRRPKRVSDHGIVPTHLGALEAGITDQVFREGRALARKTVDGIKGYSYADGSGVHVIVNKAGQFAFLYTYVKSTLFPIIAACLIGPFRLTGQFQAWALPRRDSTWANVLTPSQLGTARQTCASPWTTRRSDRIARSIERSPRHT